MSRFPRIAIGTIEGDTDPQAVSWGLLESLRRLGLQVQSFLSRASFPRHPAAAAITGLSCRHLDSWLMSRSLCRQLFTRGARGAQLAVVEGRFEDCGRGGSLDVLCQWLDLPRLAIIDARNLQPCRLPDRTGPLDGLLLDHVVDGEHLNRLATDLEALWGAPVVGALETLPYLRSQIRSIPCGERPPRELCHALGEQFAKYWKPEVLLQTAQREMPRHASPCGCTCGRGESAELTVAIAYDEAFRCYFPDTLDALEARGASIVDFSPLRDENLPPHVDLVYFGCGHPERYAAALSENHCMAAALRSHLCAGRRIYGEGGGAAYLCQQMETPSGELKRMAGILPAIARFQKGDPVAEPVEVTLFRPNWLGDYGARLHGYRTGAWRFEPSGKLTGLVAEADHQFDLVGSFLSVGSLLHLAFAAEPELVDHFFCPASPVDVCGMQPASLPPF